MRRGFRVFIVKLKGVPAPIERQCNQLALQRSGALCVNSATIHTTSIIAYLEIIIAVYILIDSAKLQEPGMGRQR